MFSRFQKRSTLLEHIDIGDYTADEYEGCIGELQIVNNWMGDSWALKRTLFRHLEEERRQDFSLLDVGAGSGELLRITAKWARQHGKRLRAVGLELNERSALAIAEESTGFSEITAVRGDALSLPFPDGSFDYVISSLFTHHLTDHQVIETLREMSRVAARRLFVIDLHRHPVAYFLYTTVGKLVLHTRLLREDGALSILRSFKPDELDHLATLAELEKAVVQRHFPFRIVLSAPGKGEALSFAEGFSGESKVAAGRAA
jgi:ubiquinone/menaquinone biosynthesis C-methylase UbiE